VVYRPNSKDKAEAMCPKNYSVCTRCLGFYRNTSLTSHVEHKCVLRPPTPDTTRNYVIQSHMFLLSQTITGNVGEKLEALVGPMLRDEVGKVVVSDPLILHVGRYYLDKKKETEGSNHLRQRMRLLGLVVIRCGASTLSQILSPSKFELILSVVKQFSPSTRIKLGGILKKATMMLRNCAIKKFDAEGREDAQSMILLLESEWGDRVSSDALYLVNRAKWDVIPILPLTEDVVKMRASLLALVDDCLQDYSMTELARAKKILLCNVQTRNKKRGGEFATTKKEFVRHAMDNYSQADIEALHQEINLSCLEKKLMKSMHLLTVPGKMGRPAAVLLSDADWALLELLMADPRAANDIYLFQSGKCEPYRGHTVMHEFAVEFDLKNPDVFT
jgi:hypothetical protein